MMSDTELDSMDRVQGQSLEKKIDYIIKTMKLPSVRYNGI